MATTVIDTRPAAAVDEAKSVGLAAPPTESLEARLRAFIQAPKSLDSVAKAKLYGELLSAAKNGPDHREGLTPSLLIELQAAAFAENAVWPEERTLIFKKFTDLPKGGLGVLSGEAKKVIDAIKKSQEICQSNYTLKDHAQQVGYIMLHLPTADEELNEFRPLQPGTNKEAFQLIGHLTNLARHAKHGGRWQERVKMLRDLQGPNSNIPTKEAYSFALRCVELKKGGVLGVDALIERAYEIWRNPPLRCRNAWSGFFTEAKAAFEILKLFPNNKVPENATMVMGCTEIDGQKLYSDNAAGEPIDREIDIWIRYGKTQYWFEVKASASGFCAVNGGYRRSEGRTAEHIIQETQHYGLSAAAASRRYGDNIQLITVIDQDTSAINSDKTLHTIHDTICGRLTATEIHGSFLPSIQSIHEINFGNRSGQ